MSEVLTCGDSSCHLDKPKGMATNGGCSCFSGLPPEQRIRVQKYIARQAKHIKELEEAILFRLGKLNKVTAADCERYHATLSRLVNKEDNDDCDYYLDKTYYADQALDRNKA
jgi:hypothetical protein